MFDSPRPAQPDLSAGSYIQPNLNYGLRIWWAFYWRTFLPSIMFIVVFNFLLRQLWLAGKLPENSAAFVSFILRFDNYAVNYIFAFFALALVLQSGSADSVSLCSQTTAAKAPRIFLLPSPERRECGGRSAGVPSSIG